MQPTFRVKRLSRRLRVLVISHRNVASLKPELPGLIESRVRSIFADDTRSHRRYEHTGESWLRLYVRKELFDGLHNRCHGLRMYF